jgi:hypothetical protein
MNTPRTKTPKRYSDPPQDEGPTGHYHVGIHNNEAAYGIGKLLTTWPHIEERMVVIFGQLTEMRDFYLARQVFRTIVSQQVRLRIMRSLLEKAPIHADKAGFSMR